MLSYNESLKILKETEALLEGHFILSSGLHSRHYIQCAKLLSQPKKAKYLCESLSQKIKEKFKTIDVVLSPALGGIVIGYEIGRQLNKKTIFAERLNGRLVLRRDFSINKNDHVLIVEDVITTGKSVIECKNLIQENEANLVGYACIIDRSNNNTSLKDKIVSQMQIEIKTFSPNELPDDLKKIEPIKPGSRNLVK